MEEIEIKKDDASQRAENYFSQPEEITINARITFVLKDDVVIENIIQLRQSEFNAFRDKLGSKQEAGLLVMQGSLSSPFDFFIIPWVSIIAIKFKNITELSESKFCCNCDGKF